MRHVVFLSVFILAVATILAIGSCGKIGPTADRTKALRWFENKSVLKTHIAYTVQEIDGCEYIGYQINPWSSTRRLIHKGNCKNHGLARELKEDF